MKDMTEELHRLSEEARKNKVVMVKLPIKSIIRGKIRWPK